MPNNQIDELIKLIEDALAENEKLSAYREYAPIFNSKKMLQLIRGNIYNIEYIKKNQNELNVGLLAAKTLDFNDVFFRYSINLHTLWHALRIYIQNPFQITNKAELDAFNFYLRHGYDPNKAANHMNGIDFSHNIDDKYILKNQKKSFPVEKYRRNSRCLLFRTRKSDFT